jgi:hypothetical protein
MQDIRMVSAFMCVDVFAQINQNPYLLHDTDIPLVVPQALGQNVSVLLDFNGLAAINF